MKRLYSLPTSPRDYHRFFRHFSVGVDSANPLRQYYEISKNSELSSSLKQIDTLKDKILQRRNKANGNLAQVIQDKLRFLWTYNSNAIEGSKLTLGDTIFFLQEGLTVGGKPLKDFVDAQNHSEAIDYLQEMIKNERAIDTYFLRSLNALLLKGVESTPAKNKFGMGFHKALTPGQYKTDPNYALQPDGSIHEFVEPHLAAAQLIDLCDWIDNNQNKQHAVLIAAVAHYNMVRIHPFQDGNGRGARLLMNLILMNQGYNPAIIETKKRKKYIKCLKEADKGELRPFTQLVADAVLKTQKDILSEINKYASKQSNSNPVSNKF